MILFFLCNQDDTWESTDRRIDYLIASFEGDVRNWWEGVTEDTKLLMRRNIQTEMQKTSQEGIKKLVEY
ncbi:hypothetical protein, partial [Sphingobacterium bovisgrunnientis]|uniref:hypothetical protein n=1 Tax=Sphingobacterium bovisgrunnientis TaxID=1874697 RepID=UPI001358A859